MWIARVAIVCAFLLISVLADAAIYSANGFTCNQGDGGIIECVGKFPNSDGTIAAYAPGSIMIAYRSGQWADVYNSRTGCLISMSPQNSSWIVKTQSGETHKFSNVKAFEKSKLCEINQ